MTPQRTVTSALAEQVGEVLAEARGERSRYAIAEALGWASPVNLLRLESGEDNPTLKRLEEVAAALGGHLEVEFVFDFADPDGRPLP